MKITSTSPFSLPETAPELARRFCAILAGLAGLVARRFVRMPHLVGFTLLLWGRLNRAVPRLAGALGSSAKARAKRARVKQVDRVRPVELPRGRGWLVRELGWEAAGYRSQLEALLAEPGMQAALAQLPGVGRILRPICRMLGAEVPGLALPKKVAVAVDVVPVVKVRRATVPVWPRKGLPKLAKGAWFAPPIQNRG